MLSLVLQTLVLCAVSYTVVHYIRKLVSQSSLNNLPGPPSNSFFKGNFKQLFRPDAWKFHNELSEKYGGVVGMHGPLGTKELYVYDPTALHHIIIKEQHVFEEALFFIESNNAVFGRGLLSTLGDHHRKQRKVLSPVFSIAHMKDITPIFFGVARQLEAILLAKVFDGPEEVELKNWLSRVALELVGQSGLGCSFDPLTENAEEHPFCTAVKNSMPTLGKLQFFRHFIFPWVYRIGTPRFQRAVVKFIPWKPLHDALAIVDIFHRTSVDIFNAKKRAIEEGGFEALEKEAGKGKDIISVLMKENMQVSQEGRLPDDEVIGQMSTLAFAATDTTSSALSRILHLLCLNPTVQERLRAEILDAQERGGKEVDYNTLSNLPYLDAVCRETLRLYPPLATLVRVAKKDTVLPLSKPVRGLDGGEISQIHVPESTRIYIALMSSNRNRDIWGPDALEWKPERWLAPLPQAVTEARIPGVYSNLMTFLGGGRACIGFKFSQLEMKAVLFVLLGSLRFELPKGKQIIWNMTGVAKPALAGDKEMVPMLPLIVSKV